MNQDLIKDTCEMKLSVVSRLVRLAYYFLWVQMFVRQAAGRVKLSTGVSEISGRHYMDSVERYSMTCVK
jgi:hypothetical protein